MREGSVVVTQLEVGDTAPTTIATDFLKDAAGNIQVRTPSGAPQTVATTESVASAVTAKLKKVQLAGSGAVAITSTNHADSESHINTGITSVTMAKAAWTPTAPNIQVVELYNDSGAAVSVTISGFTGGISVDGDGTNDIGGTGTLLTISAGAAAQIYADADGWVRGKLASQVTQAEMDAAIMLAFNQHDHKMSVRVATTANHALTGLTTIDGITPVAGNRVLVKNNTTGSQNGIYIAASAAWTRATDADGAGELNSGSLVYAEEGTVGAKTYWTLTNVGTVTIGTTALVFEQSAVSKALLDAKASTDSPTLTGTVTANAKVILGEGYNDFGGAANTAGETAGTTHVYAVGANDGTMTVISPALTFIKHGTASTKHQQIAVFEVGSHTAGLAAKTQVDLKMTDGATNTPDKTVMSFRSDGAVTIATPTTGDNTTKVATTAFVKTAVDGAVAGLLDFRGNLDASGNSFPTTGGSGTSGAVVKGDAWIVSVAGTLGTETVEAGDFVIAEVDTPTQTAANWSVINKNIGFTPENITNKVITFSTPTDTQYPSAKLVNDQLATKSATTHTHTYTKTDVGLGNVDNTSDANKPVSTAQQTALDAKQATLVSGTNIKTVNSVSIVGPGNITTSADLDGGTTTTALDDGLVSTGGTVSRASGFTRVTYLATSATAFRVPDNVTAIDYLVVAGGGGGGNNHGGGGGAGEYKEVIGATVTANQTFTITVGAGGTASTGDGTKGGSGGDTIFGSFQMNGGGGGGASPATGDNGQGVDGGSGGGGGADDSGSIAGGSSAKEGTGLGNAGGSAIGGGTVNGGGGGGSATAGGNAASASGTGGNGTTSTITGSKYAGGGSGGSYNTTVGAVDTASGAGLGTGTSSGSGANATANTGSGGGGGGPAYGDGGAGGSGIIVIRFTTQSRTYKALTAYASNAAAITGGLKAGQFYTDTTSGAVKQVS